MKIGSVFSPMLVDGRSLDFSRLWDDPRGLTGSEMSCVATTIELAACGHATTLFVENPNAEQFGDVRLRDLRQLPDAASELDVLITHSDANSILFDRAIAKTPYRVMFQQHNGFTEAREGYDREIDLFVFPSQTHLDFLLSRPDLRPPPSYKCAVIPNGCYPAAYSRAAEKKVPGRVIYTSSPDRGLHLVLQEWPAIKRAVPHASLRIFYWSLERWLAQWRGRREEQIPPWANRKVFVDLLRRAQYIEKALSLLQGDVWDVEVVGGVSRNRIAEEYERAQVLAFPVDTVQFTEGFSCATLEGCASGALPVLADCDAIGPIYGAVCPIVERGQIAAWRALVERALTDESWRKMQVERGRAFAAAHDWSALTVRFEELLRARMFVLPDLDLPPYKAAQ